MNGLGIAIAFVWAGMVLAISFLEAPLKFRAPGVTLPIGLGIGRLVFRALNLIELGFAVVLLASQLVARPGWSVMMIIAAPVLMLAGQLILIRPGLNRRTDRVLTGVDVPRSRLHHAYVITELIKVVALLGAGILLLQD
ncbi:MAG: hypothetical protein L0G99_05555 [Propionibacteriales bacterium]|nr:hypothetical protein [Propionibacteriales bacterium]